MGRVNFEWGYRLFISVDVAGSSAFKANAVKDGLPDWLETFETLFTEFPKELAKQYGGRSTMPPILWKVIGDEVVFVADLKCHCETLVHAECLEQALSGFAPFRGKLSIYLKAAAWTAGFPVTNAILRYGGVGAEDYLGPSIDLGFRLARFADRRRIPVSLELAFLLLWRSATSRRPASRENRRMPNATKSNWDTLAGTS